MAAHFHADDLGLHSAVDRAIFRAFEAGALGGASILATGRTFRQAEQISSIAFAEWLVPMRRRVC
jgi:predicted glycoside hydrolase/deacetylase ChbG (UPF0249 family)